MVYRDFIDVFFMIFRYVGWVFVDVVDFELFMFEVIFYLCLFI